MSTQNSKIKKKTAYTRTSSTLHICDGLLFSGLLYPIPLKMSIPKLKTIERRKFCKFGNKKQRKISADINGEAIKIPLFPK